MPIWAAESDTRGAGEKEIRPRTRPVDQVILFADLQELQIAPEIVLRVNKVREWCRSSGKLAKGGGESASD